MASYVSTEQYLWGLRRILDGITARVTLPAGVTARRATIDDPEPAEMPAPAGRRGIHSA
jgi:hypothetical protein